MQSNKNQYIPYGRHYIDDNDIQAVVRVLKSFPLTQGNQVNAFEEAVAHYVGARYAVAVSSGTAALHLACLAADLKPKDQLLTSSLTFAASGNCALYTGARPIFIDIDENSLNIDPQQLEVILSKSTRPKVIIPVHFAGNPCDMRLISSIARKKNLVVIEDAAHALGSTYKDGGIVGNCRYSDMTILSFHPVKLIASGEGGMITTNSKKLYQRLLSLRTHGITKDSNKFLNKNRAFTKGLINPWYYEMQDLGFNYRITDIQCALGLSQFKKISTFLLQRKKLVAQYDKAFKHHPLIRLMQQESREMSAHHIYVVRIDFKKWGKSRATLMKRMMEKNIGTQVHYMPIYLHPYYQKLGYKKGICPLAEKYYDEAVTLPLFYGLSDVDQQRVILNLKEILK